MSTEPERALVVRDLRKRYGSLDAIDGVSFDVEAGQIFGIIGANGSGKTTTVECVQALRRADSGSVRVFGLDPQSDRSRVRRMIGSQLQESELPDRMKVWEALDLFAAISPASADWHELLRDWGLAAKGDTAFAKLSGGQRQRLLVALALVNRPRMVFLDEMTTGLDPAARRAAWDLIDEIRVRGTTVVLVTHFMDEAERLCDRLLVLDHGAKIAEGRPRDLIKQHLEPDVVEVYGVGALALQESPLRTLAARVEVSGETVFFYTANAAALLQALQAYPQLRTLHRPANLEDLFLKLTGRQIREDA